MMVVLTLRVRKRHSNLNYFYNNRGLTFEVNPLLFVGDIGDIGNVGGLGIITPKTPKIPKTPKTPKTPKIPIAPKIPTSNYLYYKK